MSSSQKVLKIFAIALAVFIIFTICSTILGGISLVCGVIFYDKFEDTAYYERDEINSNIVKQDIDRLQDLRENIKLDIDLEISNLEIKKGEKFNVEKINMKNDLRCRVSGNTLKIEENNHHWFRTRSESNSTVIVTIPNDITFSKVDISTGVGKMNVVDVKTMNLEIDSGIGVANFDNVTAEKADIDCGAGNFTMTNSVLINLDLDCGMGVTRISGDIRGNSKVSCGVGKTELNLTGGKDNYKIRTEIGLGTMVLNGENCSNDIYGNGDDYIKIDGGVGRVEITTK